MADRFDKQAQELFHGSILANLIPGEQQGAKEAIAAITPGRSATHNNALERAARRICGDDANHARQNAAGEIRALKVKQP